MGPELLCFWRISQEADPSPQVLARRSRPVGCRASGCLGGLGVFRAYGIVTVRIVGVVIFC